MEDRTTMKAIAEGTLSEVSIIGNELHEENR
jgi:hypothetical protein